jgi:hypothetical protein
MAAAFLSEYRRAVEKERVSGIVKQCTRHLGQKIRTLSSPHALHAKKHEALSNFRVTPQP